MKGYLIPVLSFSTYALSCVVYSQETSFSTQLVRASYYDDAKVLVAPCRGKIGSQLNSYISMSVDRMYVRRQEGWVSALFTSNRRAYPIAKFNAKFAGDQLSINRVATSTRISGSDASADLVQGWSILDRLPYTFNEPKLELIIASSSDSNIDLGISMFQDITKAIPDATVSASTTTAMAVASAFDRYFLAPERTVNALKAVHEFPLSTGNLCEGAYVVFAARNPQTYERYLHGALTVKDNVVSYQNAPITNVSHAIFKLKITDRYYKEPSDALKDTNKFWATHFNELSSFTTSFFASVTAEKIKEFEQKSANNYLLGEEYLRNDDQLLQIEKLEILELVAKNYQTKIADLNKSISRPVPIAPNTVLVIQEEANSKFVIHDDVKEIGEKIEAGNEVTLERVPRTLRNPLKDALNSTDKLIQKRISIANEEVKAAGAEIQ